MSIFKLYRKYKGGIWYKQTLTGELPCCWGSWWTRKPHPPHRYYFTEKIEYYGINN